MPSTHAAANTLLGTAFAATCVVAPNAEAEWPTTPNESITLGIAQATFFGERQAIVINNAGTWVTWQQSICGGFDQDPSTGVVRLNRLTPDGLPLDNAGIAIQSDPTCGFVTPPVIATIPSPSTDSIVTTRGLSDLGQQPLVAYAPDAQPTWIPGFTTANPSAIQQLAALPTGDIIVASINSATIRLDRLSPDGTHQASTDHTSPSGANFVVRAIIPAPTDDHDTAFYLIWDAPTSYTRQVFIQRFDEALNLLWDNPVTPMQQSPLTGISRHTTPAATTTTEGRLLFVWTQGFESGTTPAPIRYQIINTDGSLAFSLQGARLTGSTERQFDPIALRDGVTNEISVVFRAGQSDQQTIRAQRLTATGQRLFDDQGVDITPIPLNSAFDAALLNGELHTLTVTSDNNNAAINAHQLTDQQTIRGPWPVAVAENTANLYSSIVAAESENAIVVTWQQDGPELNDTIEASRLNPAGRLGPGQCNIADIAEPFRTLDLTDIQAFITSFLDSEPAADIANPSGILDLADLTAFIIAFNGGC